MKISIKPNPGHRTDHLGRPCCAIPREDDPTRYVGARPKLVTTGAVTVTVGGKTGIVSYGTTDVAWDFEAEPLQVEDSAYYRDLLRSGALLPGDDATATLYGLTSAAQGKASK